jgi:glyoxylase-like metal-dependent hydrolase (beta-lactamase superfamily II)
MVPSSIQTRLVMATVAALCFARLIHAQSGPFTDDLITQARGVARAVPGALPRAIHYLQFAEMKAPLSALVQDAGDELVNGVYGVFQVRYADGWIMIDAGVDREAEADTTVTIWQNRYERVQRGLRGANLILITHEHHDHVAGVIRTSTPEVIVPKTILTRAQVQTLLDRPNSPLIRLTPSAAARYLTIEYDRPYPVAPGVVLIKAPGHTLGSQLVYVRLASGREALLIGDVVWMMAGLDRRRQKPEAVSRELGEDRVLLQQQIDWLAGLTNRQGIVVINSHDDKWLKALVQRGILKEDLDLTGQRH